MSHPLEATEKEILSRIVSRFLNLGQGTPLQSFRISLGPNRKILDTLKDEGYITVARDQYLPTFSAVEQLDPDVRNFARRIVQIVLAALHTLYVRHGHERATFALQEILDQVQSVGPTLDKKEIVAAVILATDFPFISTYGMGFTDMETLTVDGISLKENILDFQSVDDEWNKILAERESALKRYQIQQIVPTPPFPLEAIDFSFVADTKLRQIIERDYLELQRIKRERALKSRIILSGGLIEGLLLDALQRNEARARTSSKASKDPLDEWHLSKLIDVALDIGLISAGTERLSHGVREYRNLVHPGLEKRSNYVVGVEEANIAEEVLKMVIRDLQEGLSKQST